MEQRHPIGCDPESFIRVAAPPPRSRIRQAHGRDPLLGGRPQPSLRRSSQPQSSPRASSSTGHPRRQDVPQVPRVPLSSDLRERGAPASVHRDPRVAHAYTAILRDLVLQNAIVALSRVLPLIGRPYPHSVLDEKERSLTVAFAKHLQMERNNFLRRRSQAEQHKAVSDRRAERSSSKKRRRSFDDDYRPESEIELRPERLDSRRDTRARRRSSAYEGASESDGDAEIVPQRVRPSRPRRSKEVIVNLNEDDMDQMLSMSAEKAVEGPQRVHSGSQLGGVVASIAEGDEEGDEESDEEQTILPTVRPMPLVRAKPLCSDHMSLTPYTAEEDEGTDTEEFCKRQARNQRKRVRGVDVLGGVPNWISGKAMVADSLVVPPPLGNNEVGKIVVALSNHEVNGLRPVVIALSKLEKYVPQMNEDVLRRKPAQRSASVVIQPAVVEELPKSRPGDATARHFSGDGIGKVSGPVYMKPPTAAAHFSQALPNGVANAGTKMAQQRTLPTVGPGGASVIPTALVPFSDTPAMHGEQRPDFRLLKHTVPLPQNALNRPQVREFSALSHLSNPQSRTLQAPTAQKQGHLGDTHQVQKQLAPPSQAPHWQKVLVSNPQAQDAFVRARQVGGAAVPTPPVRVRSPEAPASRLPSSQNTSTTMSLPRTNYGLSPSGVGVPSSGPKITSSTANPIPTSLPNWKLGNHPNVPQPNGGQPMQIEGRNGDPRGDRSMPVMALGFPRGSHPLQAPRLQLPNRNLQEQRIPAAVPDGARQVSYSAGAVNPVSAFPQPRPASSVQEQARLYDHMARSRAQQGMPMNSTNYIAMTHPYNAALGENGHFVHLQTLAPQSQDGTAIHMAAVPQQVRTVPIPQTRLQNANLAFVSSVPGGGMIPPQVVFPPQNGMARLPGSTGPLHQSQVGVAPGMQMSQVPPDVMTKFYQEHYRHYYLEAKKHLEARKE